MALAILRLIGEELRKDRTARVVVQVPVEVATYVFNEKREWLRTLEDKSEIELLIVPNPHIQTPEYSISRVRDDETELIENKQASYLLPTAPTVAEPALAHESKPQLEPAAVATLLPTTSAPQTIQAAPPTLQAAPQPGLWSRLKRFFAGEPAPAAKPLREPTSTAGATRHEHSERSHRSDPRRDRARSDHRRPPRHADGARREHEPRDRNRDRDRDRDRKSRDRPPERPAEPVAAPRREEPAASALPASPASQGNEPPSDPTERSEPRRGRRGRRRGRRGGGGAGRGIGISDPGNSGGAAPVREDSRPQPAASGGNGERPEEAMPEPRETIAHFEPSVPPAAPGAAQPARPFVVWSSGPPEKTPGGDRGPDE
jgi:ribonuclease E